MVPACIDPTVGGWLREIMNLSVPEVVGWCHHDFSDLWEARLHWSGCPACRIEFASVLPVFKQIGVGLENRCRDAVSYFRDDFLRQKNSFLAVANDLASVDAEMIVVLALNQQDVFNYVIQGQEVLSFGASIASRKDSYASFWAGGSPSLSYCQECLDFISSLEPDVQQFVFAVACSHDLLMPVYETLSERATGTDFEVLRDRMAMAITNSELHPTTLLSIIEKASIAYSASLGSWPTGTGLTTVAQTISPQSRVVIQEMKALLDTFKEFKRDFDNFEDSMKAGQMELLRQIEHNRRPAAAHEQFIIDQLGEPLYSRLHQTTQQALQLVEYYYSINQEPDAFGPFAIKMALGYENELNVRIIRPIVIELLAAGTQTYDAHGKSKVPLIRCGKVHRWGTTLGSLAWFLGKDPVMRSKVSGRGFDVEAISKDAAWVSDVRNKAAHDCTCDRTLADELRRRILTRDGILSRLHPGAAGATNTH